MIDLAIVGCGDVAHRSYLPGLQTMAGEARVAQVFDPDPERARRAVAACAAWSPAARAAADLQSLLADETLDGVINLTPAPLHATITRQALTAGRNVLSEKPLARTAEEARGLVELAEAAGLQLLCAPAVMSVPRFRWIRRLIDEGHIGRPTLALGQVANLGPAALRGYTGDVSVFYSAAVGPLVDQGVYLLHALVGLLGPVRAIQAMGAIAIPQRRALVGTRRGETVDVQTQDHVLLQLELVSGCLVQVLSSFAVPATRAPSLEVHGTAGSLSLMDLQSAHRPVDIFIADPTELGVEGWLTDVPAGSDRPPLDDVIALGPTHYVRCLQGVEPSRMPARDACHVLEIFEHVSLALERGGRVELHGARRSSASTDERASA